MESSELEANGLITGAAQTQAVTRKGEKRAKTSSDQTWQQRLLPLMVGMLVALTEVDDDFGRWFKLLPD